MLKEELQGEDVDRFVMNFQLYLLYRNDNTKFVVDLDNVWEWLGFSKKDKAKNVLKKHFEVESDYVVKKAHPQEGKRLNGGQNKEQVLMNVETFKGLCMLANTEKGKRTRDFCMYPRGGQ